MFDIGGSNPLGPTLGTTQYRPALVNDAGEVFLCIGSGTPPTDAGTFAVGGLLIRTDGVAAKIYQNVGTVASPSWNSIGDIAPGELTLTDGHLYVGGVTNVAADVALSGDATITNAGVLTIAAGAVTPAKMTITYTFTGDALAGHTHGFTGDALAGHSHGFTGDALAGHTHGFTGDALGTHSHAAVAANETQGTATIRIYISGATGTFTVGETITGGTSAQTATVAEDNSVHTTYLVITAPSGEFTDAETITGGTSGKSATVVGTLVDHWDVSGQFTANAAINAVSSNTDQALLATTSAAKLAANGFRFRSGDVGIETKHSDGWTSVTVEGTSGATSAVSAGTPSGTNASVTGGTPSGTISSDSAGTPSGTNASVSAGTPSGAVSAA